MIRLSSFEHSIRRALTDVARRADPANPTVACLTYGQLGSSLDPTAETRYPMTRPPFRGLSEALGHVSMYEVEHGRPMLTALVVNQDSRRPGPGFASLAEHLGREVSDQEAFWQRELATLIDFWTDPDGGRALDAAIERVVGETMSVKARLKRLGPSDSYRCTDRPKAPVIILKDSVTGDRLGTLAQLWHLPRVGETIELHVGDPEQPERNRTPEFGPGGITEQLLVEGVIHKLYRSYEDDPFGGDFPHDGAFYDDIVVLTVRRAGTLLATG